MTRVAAQVVAGIGFLGAGVIIKDDRSVKGLTTAATLWCSAAIGILCSANLIFEAAIGTVLILFTNIILRSVNSKINFLSGNVNYNLYHYTIVCEEKNDSSLLKIIKEIVLNVIKNDFKGIFLNATNPLDIMTQLIFEYSNFSANKVIGTGTNLDSARLKYYLNEHFNTEYDKIYAYVLGEHGDSSMIPWSKVTVNNLKVINSLTSKEKNDYEEKVRNAGYELLNSKGYSDLAIGICLADITKIIINKEEKEVCVSNYDENEEIYYGYPAIINETGIKSRLKLELTLDEQEKLNNSIAIIKKALKELKEKDL